MANTLKFGNGNWATKEDSILAYIDQYDNFKPLPFDFARASNATVVNKEGLIETVANGIPRIDFQGNTQGALLLEPQRTNSLLQSNQFDTTWTLSSSIDITSNQSGVGGSNNAWLLKRNSIGSRYVQQALSLSSATYSYSVYLKAESSNWAYFWSYDGSESVNAYFDLENGVVGDTSGSNLDSATIESVGNGWYRVTLIYTQGTTLLRIYPAYSNGSIAIGTDNGIYIQYAQIEQASYPTSYIPTQGSTVTRVVDSCSQTPPTGVIGQTEGTIFAEYYFDATIDNSGGSDRDIVNINDGTFNNIIQLVHYGNGIGSAYKSVYLNARLSSSYVVSIASSAYGSGLMKVACGYKNNDYVLYVNGVQIGTDTNAGVPSCSVINFAKITGIQTPTPINQTKLYNTRLSNSELATLTTI